MSCDKLRENIVNQIKDLMQKRNMTRKELAEKLGVDISRVSKILNGNKISNLNKLCELVRVLDGELEIVIKPK
jgi:transcriptional regulator with XRE-family HTH domain